MTHFVGNRRILAATASLLALATAVPAFAQDAASAQTTDPVPASPTTQDDTSVTDVVVTGSRIRRPDFSSPSPILSLGADTVQESGNTNLTSVLTGYPALVGSGGSNINSGDRAGIGETGLNLLDLRNLGRQRTLVLVDGRRHVASVPGEQSVDINTIPTDLVESIDILTGGASAIYGADGVSGVVNFRMKQNFEGLSLRGQAGISEQGDAGQRLLGATVGKNFAEGRGNIALAYEYGADDRLRASDRKALRGTNPFVFVANPDDPNDDPNLPDRIPVQDIRYGISAPNGAVDIDGDYTPEFDGNGRPFDNGIDYGEGFVLGGSSTPVSRYLNDQFPSIERHVANAIGHFDISDKLTLYAEGKYANVRSYSLAQPTFEYGTFIEADNPYLPANIRAAIDPTLGGVLVNRDNFDQGPRAEDVKRQTYRFVAGARGDISDSFHYDLSYVYGKTKVRSRYIGDVYNDRFFAAVDAVRDPATGQITCRVNLQPNWTPNQPFESGRTVADPTTFKPGECRPINILGEGLSDPAGIAFITAPTTDRSSITQQVINGAISGDFRDLFSLPGGPIGFAVGGEYRKEKSSFDPDPIEAQGLTYTNKLAPTKGSFHVKEVFAELNAPVLKDRPFFHNLEVGAAIRYSDYSTIGTTTTWKVDGMYAPVRDISFRGTYSVAIRAPNIGELFGGLSQTFEFFNNDPCLPDNLNNGTSFRAANCATLLSGLGANPATYDDDRSFNVAGLQGGNPDLTEEKAKTWTAGVVLSPRFLPGLTLSADWYDIRLTNAINQVGAIQLAELCVDQPDINNQFCDAIQRQNGPGTNVQAGNVIGFTVGPKNVAAFQTAGLDLNVNWRIQTASLGNFNVKVFANYLDKLTFVGTPGADPTDSRGVGASFSPKYQVTGDLTWNKGPFTLNYGLSWFDKTLRASNLTVAGDPDYYAPEYLYYKERWVHDVYAAYSVNDRFQFYGGVNNVANQKPDIGSTGLGGYPVDYKGRFFYVGARVKLPKF